MALVACRLKWRRQHFRALLIRSPCVQPRSLCASVRWAVFALTDKITDLWECSLASTLPMTFLMHWSFKTGYHEIAAKKFLATGAPFPECTSWKRWHGPGSVEGWILVEADNADACYEHAAEWAECLDWEVTPVLSDEQAGPLIAKAYS